ncbi:hypothetical protein STEG23_019669, partial [Scotinomys teguina]
MRADRKRAKVELKWVERQFSREEHLLLLQKSRVEFYEDLSCGFSWLKLRHMQSPGEIQTFSDQCTLVVLAQSANDVAVLLDKSINEYSIDSSVREVLFLEAASDGLGSLQRIMLCLLLLLLLLLHALLLNHQQSLALGSPVLFSLTKCRGWKKRMDTSP